jgi:hypothetical protein
LRGEEFTGAGERSLRVLQHATMEVVKPSRSPEADRARRYQQDGFSVVWLLIALCSCKECSPRRKVVGLPMMVVGALDFEGSNGILTVAVPVWFGGYAPSDDLPGKGR